MNQKPFTKIYVGNKTLINIKTRTPMTEAKNVLGTTLQVCSTNPMTGFYRDGCCETGIDDVGTHIVCAQVTEEFLAFTQSRGNDLSTPIPQYHFPGLRPGDRWCLCISRWLEAYRAGVAPYVILEATHEAALKYVSLEVLQKFQFSNQD